MIENNYSLDSVFKWQKLNVLMKLRISIENEIPE